MELRGVCGRMVVSFGLVTLVMIFLLVASALAEEDKALLLDEMVVSATKTEEKIKDIPSSVSVIKGSEIEDSGVRNVADALNWVAGVEIMDVEGNGTQVMLTMRGMPHGNSQYVSVLVDGIPCNDPNDRVQWAAIPIENVERIEVIKGPGSALYGMNAMGGVINIITKRPTEEREIIVSGGYGSYNENKVGASFSQNLDDVFFTIGATWHESDGWREENNHYEKYNVYGKFGYDINKSSVLTLSFAYSSWDNEWPDYVPISLYKEDRDQVYYKHGKEEYDSPNGSLIYENTINEHLKLTNRAYVQQINKKWWNIVDFIDEDFDGTTFGDELQLQIDHTIFKMKNTVVVGGSYEYEDLDLVRRFSKYSGLEPEKYLDTTTERLIGAFYIQDEIHLLDNLTAFAGVRYDNVYFDYKNHLSSDLSDTETLEAWSPKTGIVFEPIDGLSLYANVSTGFKTPTAAQVARWPGIDPENAFGYEFGVKGSLFDRFTCTVAYYHTVLEDQLAYVVDDSEDSGYRLANAGESEIHGVEAEMTFRPIEELAIFANYNYNVSEFDTFRDERSGVDYSDNTLALQPRHKIVGGIRYQHPIGIKAAITTKWIDSQYLSNVNEYSIDPYTITDLKISYTYNFAEFSLAVRNLFDEEYEAYGDDYGDGDVYLTPGDPLTVFGAVTLRF